MRLWVRGRGAAPHQPPGRGQLPRRARPGPEGSIAQAGLRRAQQATSTSCASTCSGRRGCSTTATRCAGRRTPAGAARPAAHVPPGSRQLDRGRHLRGHAQHPGRAGPRPARRRPGRQGHSLVPGPAQLTQGGPSTALDLAAPPARTSRSSRSPSRGRINWASTPRAGSRTPARTAPACAGAPKARGRCRRRRGPPLPPRPGLVYTSIERTGPPWLRSSASATCSRAISLPPARGQRAASGRTARRTFWGSPACGSGPGTQGPPAPRAGTRADARSRSGRRCGARGPPC